MLVDELQDGIAQKLKPLVVACHDILLICKRRVRQRVNKKLPVNKRVTKPTLKYRQVENHR